MVDSNLNSTHTRHHCCGHQRLLQYSLLPASPNLVHQCQLIPVFYRLWPTLKTAIDCGETLIPTSWAIENPNPDRGWSKGEVMQCSSKPVHQLITVLLITRISPASARFRCCCIDQKLETVWMVCESVNVGYHCEHHLMQRTCGPCQDLTTRR